MNVVYGINWKSDDDCHGRLRPFIREYRGSVAEQRARMAAGVAYETKLKAITSALDRANREIELAEKSLVRWRETQANLKALLPDATGDIGGGGEGFGWGTCNKCGGNMESLPTLDCLPPIHSRRCADCGNTVRWTG